MKIVLAATGASGAIYLQRLLSRLDTAAHEVHLVFSTYARQVVHEELGELVVPAGVHQHGDKTMNVPFVSGSARFDAMVVVPCSMGTLGRIAGLIGESGANIIDVTHHRLFLDVPAKAADLDFTIETRDAEHTAAVEAALHAAGLMPRRLSSSGS